MRILISLLLLFALAIGLAVGARFTPGNVVFFYPPYRVDLSLNLFLLLTFLAFTLLYFVIQALRTARTMPARVAAYRRDRRDRESNQSLREALKLLFEGRFGHAEKAAERASENPEVSSLASLIGARAAHRLNQHERRDAWLAKTEADPSMKTASLMTAMEIAIDGQQPERALTVLRELNASGTRHIHALRLALKASQRVGDWAEVLRLVRLLDKRSALHAALSRRLRDLAYEDLLVAQARDAESLRRIWNGIPSDERVMPFVALRAARAFHTQGLNDEARGVIEKALMHDWDERLVRAYGESAAAEGSPALLLQIERCEEWLRNRPADPELALTLGSLCLRQNLWGKAQRHLEHALSMADDADTVSRAHLKLAQMHEAVSQPEVAAGHYRLSALAAQRRIS